MHSPHQLKPLVIVCNPLIPLILNAIDCEQLGLSQKNNPKRNRVWAELWWRCYVLNVHFELNEDILRTCLIEGLPSYWLAYHKHVAACAVSAAQQR